jgi:peptidoglycan/xylan/chitin deacetylase (PgdA/CDA1 family)
MYSIKFILTLIFLFNATSVMAAENKTMHLAKLEKSTSFPNEIAVEISNENIQKDTSFDELFNIKPLYKDRLDEIDKKLLEAKEQIKLLESEKKNIYLSIHSEEKIRREIAKAKSLKEFNSKENFDDELKEEIPQKIIYLTFDDGPLRGTKNILEVLEEENVKATMFFVGKHILNNKKLFNKASNSTNVLIGNHTFSHANGHYSRFYRNGKKLLADIKHAQDIIGGSKYQRLAGRNVWRLPEVYKNDNGVKRRRRKIESANYDSISEDGYYIYGWDIEWTYYNRSGKPRFSAKKMAAKIERCYRRGRVSKKRKLVLLAHDFMFKNKFHGKAALKDLISRLKASGWQFETLSNYAKDRPQYYVKEQLKDEELVLAKKNIWE